MTDDETLMAYVDGELDAERTAELEARLAADPNLAQRAEAQRTARRIIGRAHADVLNEPVPAALLDAVRGSPQPNVVDFASGRRMLPRLPQWAALAATLVAGVLLSLGAQGLKPEPMMVAGGSGLQARGELAAALDERLAADGGPPKPVTVGLSFRSREGYCRTFQVAAGDPLAGVACKDDGVWRVRLTVDGDPNQKGGDYRLAASSTPPEVLGFVDQIIEGAPLDAAGERQAKTGGWRLPPQR